MYNPEPFGAKPPSLALDEKNRFAFRYAKEDVSLWCQLQAYPIPAYRCVKSGDKDCGLKKTKKFPNNYSQSPSALKNLRSRPTIKSIPSNEFNITP